MNEKLSEKEIQKIREVMLKEITSRPPTIGVIGVSGVGKSTTLNTLFKTNLPTSDTVACTKDFRAESLGVAFQKGHAKDEKVSLVVIDAPGLGEDVANDPQYLEMYKKNLGQCDVILWIMTGRNRAIALDQMYLQQLSEFHPRIVFGINQVELIEPQAWDSKINLPMDQQQKNITIIENDRKEKLGKILGRDVRLCSFSAKNKYNLPKLFGLILDSCPNERRWIFDGLKNFHYTDFLPEEIRSTLSIYGSKST